MKRKVKDQMVTAEMLRTIYRSNINKDYNWLDKSMNTLQLRVFAAEDNTDVDKFISDLGIRRTLAPKKS